MKYYLCFIYFIGVLNVYAHVPIYLENRSSVPVVSPQGVVIQPFKTDVWNVLKSSPKTHEEKVMPKPWRHVKGCTAVLKDTLQGLKKTVITIRQKRDQLICTQDHAALKLERGIKKKNFKEAKAPMTYKPEDELYILPPSRVSLLPQITELMVYALPERKKIEYADGSVAIQPTKIIY